MTAPMQDPFYVVKEEVLQSLHGITTLYDRWRELLSTTNTTASEEFKWTTNELKNGIKSIEWDLTDLEETIGVVESNRAKFKIDVAEIQTRKAFVAETRKKVSSIKEDMSSTRSKGIQDKNQRDILMNNGPKRGDKFTRLEGAIQADNEDFIKEQTMRQQQIFRDQDQNLDQLKNTVGTLKNMSSTIGQELKEQEQLIEDIDHGVEKADSGLKGVVKKVNGLIDQTSDTKQLIFIGVLIIVLVLLIVLVIKL